ncbi:MAG: PEGA domain-containing protein [Deltaproteobacteria bacterium]|nr:PEGA domain-containing protein [Deltaproteobacteria bacterium]
MKSAWTTILIAALLVASRSEAQTHGTKAGRRSIAVLEFRAGVQAAPQVTERLVKLLQRKSALRVLALSDARQQLGSSIDSKVADCEGKPRCIAAIGRRLHVDEVLLVGLTQLGNVIVDIARVQAKNGRILNRIALTSPVDERIPSQRLYGALRQLLPRSAFLRYGAIRVRCNVQGARVTIGTKVFGKTPIIAPIRVRAPNDYQITISKPGYMSFKASFHVPPRATITANANLVPLMEGKHIPIYKKWWFWTAIGGGTAAVVAATVAGILLWQKSKPHPSVVQVELP